ncbi:MAG: hypothetical protein Q4P72_03735 [Eubacteriales bacterium]|nr:hypothetical protein [Eubacteriales bacterium]
MGEALVMLLKQFTTFTTFGLSVRKNYDDYFKRLAEEIRSSPGALKQSKKYILIFLEKILTSGK